MFRKDVGEEAILCFKDTGDQTIFKNVPSAVSLTHQTAPSPTFLVKERGTEGERGQSFIHSPPPDRPHLRQILVRK